MCKNEPLLAYKNKYEPLFVNYSLKELQVRRIRFGSPVKMIHPFGQRSAVDWTGDTASIQGTLTGKPIPAYLFIAVLSPSGYAYAEGFLVRDLASWITVHRSYSLKPPARRHCAIRAPDPRASGLF
jgi:hypothetical protein